MNERYPSRLRAALRHDTRASLGEGPFWHPEEARLYWIDIEGFALHRWDPGHDLHWQVALPAMPGAVVPMAGCGLLLALADGLATMDPETAELHYLNDWLRDEPKLRANDGKCDPQGRFWIGSMHLDLQPQTGTLYRVGPDLRMLPQREGVTISNGLAWSPSGDRMYYIDSAPQRVYAYEVAPETGRLGPEQVVIEVPEDWGAPDGMSIDEHGNLWIAHWGGSCVRCWDPEQGALLTTIDLPVPHVTSCCFGGPHHRTLYITTARSGLSGQDLVRFPQSGGLFTCELPVAGRPVAFFQRES